MWSMIKIVILLILWCLFTSCSKNLIGSYRQTNSFQNFKLDLKPDSTFEMVKYSVPSNLYLAGHWIKDGNKIIILKEEIIDLDTNMIQFPDSLFRIPKNVMWELEDIDEMTINKFGRIEFNYRDKNVKLKKQKN